MQQEDIGKIFCDLCKNLLSFEKKRIFCYFCNEEKSDIDLSTFKFVTKSTSKVFLENKRKEKKTEIVKKEKKVFIKETCPECQHPELSFYTMQLRSIDEGQTVFYTCPKCDHKFSVHT